MGVEQSRRVLYDESGRPTPRFTRYLAVRHELRQAEHDYEEALAEARKDPTALQQWPMTGAARRRKLERARAHLAAIDPSKEIEIALADFPESQD